MNSTRTAARPLDLRPDSFLGCLDPTFDALRFLIEGDSYRFPVEVVHPETGEVDRLTLVVPVSLLAYDDFLALAPYTEVLFEGYYRPSVFDEDEEEPLLSGTVDVVSFRLVATLPYLYEPTGICPKPTDLSLYYCSQGVLPADTGGWTETYLLDAAREESRATIFEFGSGELPSPIADIRGRIENEPERVFAWVDTDGEAHYFGLVRRPCQLTARTEDL